jgi:hypothetical protein
MTVFVSNFRLTEAISRAKLRYDAIARSIIVDGTSANPMSLLGQWTRRDL